MQGKSLSIPDVGGQQPFLWWQSSLDEKKQSRTPPQPIRLVFIFRNLRDRGMVFPSPASVRKSTSLGIIVLSRSTWALRARYLFKKEDHSHLDAFQDQDEKSNLWVGLFRAHASSPEWAPCETHWSPVETWTAFLEVIHLSYNRDTLGTTETQN